MERVGIRQLRENLRTYLRRASEGDAFEVTEYGRPVARLGPLAETGTQLTRLIAGGRATPARRPIDRLPPVIHADGRSATDALLAERRSDAR